MVVAIDFDGTIHDYKNPKEGRRMGPPFEGTLEALTALRAAGHKIIIHSCNRPKVIRDWMEWYKIPFDYIWGESPGDYGQKPVADWYVDDRAIPFKGDWVWVLGVVNSA